MILYALLLHYIVIDKGQIILPERQSGQIIQYYIYDDINECNQEGRKLSNRVDPGFDPTHYIDSYECKVVK